MKRNVEKMDKNSPPKIITFNGYNDIIKHYVLKVTKHGLQLISAEPYMLQASEQN